MLEVSGLKVRYGEVQAVKGLNLSVPKGSVVALLGANGAGKSSTLNAIAGLVPASGTVTFEGRSITGFPAETIVRGGLALTPEGRRVFPSLTVAENLWLGGASHGPESETLARAEEQYARFPILRERRAQRAGLLSGGEQQMLAVARSLMSNPRLLLLDEPSLGLAPKIVVAIFGLIADLRGKGLTVLLVEQNAERALEIADYGYVLQTGQAVLEGKGADLLKNDLVTKAYLAE